MIKSIINVDNYWIIILFIDIDYNKYHIIEDELIKIGTPGHIIKQIYNRIGYKSNSGFTYSNYEYRTSVVGINEQTSKEELINTLSHEADHVQTHICDYYNVDIRSEDAAYLIGYIIEYFYKSCIDCFC